MVALGGCVVAKLSGNVNKYDCKKLRREQTL